MISKSEWGRETTGDTHKVPNGDVMVTKPRVELEEAACSEIDVLDVAPGPSGTIVEESDALASVVDVILEIEPGPSGEVDVVVLSKSELLSKVVYLETYVSAGDVVVIVSLVPEIMDWSEIVAGPVNSVKIEPSIFDTADGN